MERLYIPELEEMVTGRTPLSDTINRRLLEAYDKNTRAKNSRLDFDEIVFEEDVAEIVKFMREHSVPQNRRNSTYYSSILAQG